MADETRHLLAAGGASDVELITYPAECTKRGMNWGKVQDIIGTAGEPLCVVGAQCLQGAGPLPKDYHLALGSRTDQCFDLFCERAVLEKCIGTGAYIVLPGWLRHWRQNLQSWGMDQEVARSFFRESVENVVLMVTIPYEGMEKDLEEFAAFVARPQVVIEVGLDRYHALLTDAVRETRHGHQMAEIKAKLTATEMARANQALALDRLRHIAQLNDEDVIVAALVDLCELLFSPGEIRYRACHEEEGEARRTDTFGPAGDGNATAIPVKRGLIAPLATREGLLGVLEVKEVASPRHLDQYVTLASEICTVVGLSISRARAFQELAEAKARAQEMLRLEEATAELSRLLAMKEPADLDYSVEARILGEAAEADRVEILLPGGVAALVTAGSWSSGAATATVPVTSGGQDLLESVEMLVVRSAGKGSSRGSMMAANVQLQGRAQGLVVLSSQDPDKQWKKGVDNLVTIFARMLAGILERERMNRELLSLNDSLHITNKIMRHDIRNELLVTSGALELYRLRSEPRHLDMATDSIARVCRMLDQMKEMDTFLRTGAGLRPFSVREAAEVAMAGNNLPIDVRGEAEVMADHALYSVLDNLVRNARVHGGSTVRVLISGRSSDVTVRVEDCGRGIPAEAMPHIFEEGYAQGPTQGTGLGLFIVKRTMDRYGGTVHAEQNHPHGTVLVLTFPAPPA